MVFKMSIDIAASRQHVWPLLVDWENLGRWMKEASNFRVTSAHRQGVGVTAQASIRIAGFRITDPICVTVWDPPRLLVIEHRGWVAGTGRMELSGAEGTLIEWTENLAPPWGLMGAIGMHLVSPVMHRVFRRDLKLLKQLAETPSDG